jgi:hypothetical protein
MCHERRKRILVCLALIMFVGGGGTWWLVSSPGANPGALAITMHTLRNEVSLASFQIDNPGRRLVAFRFMVEEKHGTYWPSYAAGTALPHPGPNLELKPGGSTNLLVAVPKRGAWRISVVYWEPADRRDRFSALLRACSLNVIADKLSANKPAFHVYGPACGK